MSDWLEDIPAISVGKLCRRMISSSLFCSLLLLLVMDGDCFAAPTIPIPSWMERTAIARKMVVNGLPSEVHSFEAGRGLDELLRFYRQRWRTGNDGKPGYRVVTSESWYVISRLEGRYLLTVQARAKNTFVTEGFLAVADLNELENNDPSKERIPKMAGSRVVNDTTSYDPGKKGRTLMIINNFSVSTNSTFYQDHYLDRGWGLLENQDFNGAQVLAFRRIGREAHLVIRDSGEGSVVVMNLVEND